MAAALQGLVLLVLAALLARVARALRVPALVGMIAAGIVTRSVLGGEVITAMGVDGPVLDDVAPAIRLGVLAIVLLRAGLGISFDDFARAGGLAARLGTLPLLGDALAVAAVGVWVLGLPLPVAAVLGLLVAPISPAIVIPGLLELLGRKPDRGARRVLTGLLVGAPFDNILAVLGLGVALDLATAGDVEWSAAAAMTALSIAGGLVLGGVGGVVLGLVTRATALRGWVGAALSWAVACGLIVVGQRWGMSFVLAVLATGLLIRRISGPRARAQAKTLARAFGGAQYALFGLIGHAVDLGPLADGGPLLVLAIIAGQVGRLVGVAVATSHAGLGRDPRMACAMAYVPKATIQAAFAALALERGVEGGELILAAGVLAIVITAPTGALALHRGARRLLWP